MSSNDQNLGVAVGANVYDSVAKPTVSSNPLNPMNTNFVCANLLLVVAILNISRSLKSVVTKSTMTARPLANSRRVLE